MNTRTESGARFDRFVPAGDDVIKWIFSIISLAGTFYGLLSKL